MTKERKSTINVQGTAITILSQREDDFISLTDMANKFGGDDLIYNWMRNRNTVEFLGIWEQIHNPDFKGVEFDTFKKEAGLNSFRLTPKKWIDANVTPSDFFSLIIKSLYLKLKNNPLSPTYSRPLTKRYNY
jgi:hypothetical protein